MWFLYAILGAFITGIGQVLVKRGQVKLTPLLDNLLATAIVTLILVPFLFIRGVDIEGGRNILIYALIAAAMYATFYYIISFGNVSLMVSLINTFPVVIIILAVGFLRELPSLYQWFGIILVISGTIFISREKIKKRAINRKKLWVIWGLLGSLAIGIAEFVTKLATLRVDGFTFTFFVYLMYIPPLIIFMAFDKNGRKFEKLKNKSSLLYTLIGIFFIEVGLIAIALAYQYGQASLVSPVVSTHMLITALLAAFFLKERLLTIQKIGILVTLIGVSVIGIWS
ncbi:MAG: hypothetical protein A3B44_04325 [Candidatus Levybacteria bacterium RIFCSPLOWO2_01_FULL_38_21]|nr:MAG: hypothetical protein A3B44_04325 [Candidatus Levybacteria bacterium RIFCSPLOWO2_01_FULL_38_21]